MTVTAPDREIEALLQRTLEQPGLVPRLCTAATDTPPPSEELTRLLADETLAARPAAGWDPRLLGAWNAGAIYLRDELSRLSERLVVVARRVVFRHSQVAAFGTVYGRDVLIDNSAVGSHASLVGPLALYRCVLGASVVAGPSLVFLGGGMGAFSKAQRHVRIESSLIAAGVLIEGGSHPDVLPMGRERRRLGVTIGPRAWVGQQASITAGAVIGTGVVVAPRTSVTRAFPEHAFVSGEPARAAPVDFAIRGLSPEEAEAEGRGQGMSAWGLPIFGRHAGAVVPPRTIALDYPEHGVLRGLCSENVLWFQRGVLADAFAQLLRDNPATIRFEVGRSVRFTVELEREPRLGRPNDPALVSVWQRLINARTLPPFEPAEPVAPVAPVAPAAAPDPGGGSLGVIGEVVGRLLGLAAPPDPDVRFAELGLDSVGLVQLSVILEDRLGIPTPDVFANDTGRKLAGAIDAVLTLR